MQEGQHKEDSVHLALMKLQLSKMTWPQQVLILKVLGELFEKQGKEWSVDLQKDVELLLQEEKEQKG